MIEGTKLVGRAAEVADLEAEYRRAAAGELRCVLLTGDAGVGKTSLANDVVARHAPGATILSPGPRALGFKDGLAADPSTIGNFRGLVALAYMRGRVRDSSGRRWLMVNDMRLFQGDYVSADGIQRQGTFAFV